MPTVRRSIFRASSASFPYRIASDRTEPRELRERAIRGLGDEFRDAGALRDLYEQESDAALKERIIRVVGEDRGEASGAWLRDVISDRSERTAPRDHRLHPGGQATETQHACHQRGGRHG